MEQTLVTETENLSFELPELDITDSTLFELDIMDSTLFEIDCGC